MHEVGGWIGWFLQACGPPSWWVGLVPGLFVESVGQGPRDTSKINDQETWPGLKTWRHAEGVL